MDLVYDGFISYSHSADDLLAPRLQSALQRFAKPWWKRRAVRIFRDESSLSANPHLWSSITEALDTSGWFVLLLSPDAASSEWVNQEIAYWVEHRDPTKILPVVTDGEFGWDGDVVGSAAPAALAGVFSEEPRWVDLRGVDSETELDLQNPEFAAAIADIASTIRGIPKDELASEEVRQHRRTVRTAWAAGALVGALGVASVVFGIGSARNAAEAERQQQIAADNAAEADRQRVIAEQSAADALDQAENAEARRLTAEAARALDRDVQLSMLLLLEAFSVAVDEDLKSEIAVAASVAAEQNRLLERFEVTPWSGAPNLSDPNPGWRFTFDNRAVLSPDGRTIHHITRETNRFVAFAVNDGHELWEWAPDPGEALRFVSVSPDGDTVALSVDGRVGSAGRVVIFNDAGDQLAELPTSGCRFVVPAGPGFSPDGAWFSIVDGNADCEDLARVPDADWAVVFDTSTWEESVRHVEPSAISEMILLSMSNTTALLAFLDDQGLQIARLVTYPELKPVLEFGARAPSLAPDGRTVAYTAFGPNDVDFLTIVRRLIPGFEFPTEFAHDFSLVRGGPDDSRFGRPPNRAFSFSPDGTLMAAVSAESDAVLDVSNGAVVLQLYESADTFDASWSEDGTLLLTSHPTELLLWSVVPVPIPNEVLASRNWIGYAKDSLVRGFTVAECAEFDIGPCPTLEEMRSR